MGSVKVVFILGAGPRIGESTAAEFTLRGYKVALASRSCQDGTYNSTGALLVRLDLADFEAVKPAFARVEKAFGHAPSVVVYNGYSRTLLPDTDPLSGLILADAQRDHAVNALSALAAAQCAVAGFDRLPGERRKTFIYTGNKLNVLPTPNVLTFGMDKTSAWHMVAALVKGYKDRGFRFYYTDERQPSGEHAGVAVSGEARAALHVHLAEAQDQGPWYHTFVKGRGYTKFGESIEV